MGRKILFVTVDQQRFDALGCNGGTIARTPVVDGLASAGIRYDRAHPGSVVCMPSRASIFTGQFVRSHGVWMNGVPLPSDSPSVARVLNDAGYRTALVGKAHFEPHLDPEMRFRENRMARDGEHGPYRGFDHMELATHSSLALHYGAWMLAHHPDEADGFYHLIGPDLLQRADGGGDTGAVQVKHNPVAREHYHTDWVADRAIAWLDSLDESDDWFCWMSFPDPHHAWDPPASELGRVPWRELDLPPGYPSDPAEREALVDAKPRQWGVWYRGERHYNFEAPPRWVPAEMTPDQVREVNAMVHVSNELADEALGRVLRAVDDRGWAGDTDVFYASDHGELQGDFGFLFKGPLHVDALLRVPLVWRPAPSAGVTPAEVPGPVGLMDLAPTWCEIAGVDVPDWMQGTPLPVADEARGGVVTEWDSVWDGVDVHLRTICRDGYLCTVYLSGTFHDGTEGELYDLAEDPLQRTNLWDDPARRGIRDDLVADLRDTLPPERTEWAEVVAPV